MRIGLDCRIAHYTSGGTGVYARRLAEALSQLLGAGDELLILQAASDTAPIGRARRSKLYTPSHHRWEQLLLPLELLPRRLDVLHSTDFIPPFFRTCRSVITVHDLAFLRWPEHLTAPSRAYFNGHIRKAVRSADAIIAVSQATKRDLVELLNVSPDKITVVYEAPGFDSATRSGADVADWLRSHDLPQEYVLFVGTFEPRKNLPRLIEAFAAVRRDGYDGKLLLAGSAGWLSEASLEAAGRRPGDVLVHQLVPGDLPYLYAGARLLAWPSLYEGFGLPVLEAMAHGLPVLTSNVSSLPEITGDAALLVDPLDVDAIAGGLQRLLRDTELAAGLAKRGLARAAEFSWQRAARETLDVYHRVT